jgi:hypothetical protein
LLQSLSAQFDTHLSEVLIAGNLKRRETMTMYFAGASIVENDLHRVLPDNRRRNT